MISPRTYWSLLSCLTRCTCVLGERSTVAVSHWGERGGEGGREEGGGGGGKGEKQRGEGGRGSVIISSSTNYHTLMCSLGVSLIPKDGPNCRQYKTLHYAHTIACTCVCVWLQLYCNFHEN